MAQFTLDDIRSAAEAQYGSLDIPLSPTKTVKMLNAMRHPKEKRAAIMALQDELNALRDKGVDDEGKERELTSDESVELMSKQEELMDRLLIAVCESDEAGRALLEALGGDITQKMVVFEKYSEGTQAGEASTSQS